MIRGERVIQLNMALLIIMGALLLSIAQDDKSVLLITFIGVSFSLIIVDWLKWISFHPYFINAVAFTVSFISFTQFSGGNTGTKLNAVASLLTYLQLVLLLQRKSPRLYWQVMMLSLLQVVVAAALNLDFSAGLVFFGYIILVVTGTIHLKIYRNNYRLAESEKHNDQVLKKLTDEPVSSETTGVMTFRASEIDFRNEKKIAWQGVMLCLVSLFFAFTIFYSIPRFGDSWRGPGGGARQQTGFAKEIRFDDQGFLYNSNRNVLRASFLDDSGQPMQLAIEPYFKGLLLKDYLPINGNWTWSNVQNSNPGRLGQGAYRLQQANNEKINYIRQVIRLEPSAKVRLENEESNHLVFSVFPVFQNDNTPDDLVYNILWDILFRDANQVDLPESAPYNFELLTPLYRNLGQVPAIPVSLVFKFKVASFDYFKDELDRLTGRACDRFDDDWTEIRELATSIVQGLEADATRRSICNRFVNHLKKPEFTYTRDLASIEMDPNIDPIVDFLLNHKSGHCEYYATALALMLRSQGIPCRIVTGYYGGDYNEIGGFYLVKEKHAHVWVEAYLPPEECDQDMIDTGQASELGAWLRLDPTPGAEQDSNLTATTLIDRAFDAIGFAQKIWDDYVTGLEQDSRVMNGFDPTSPDDEFSWGAFSLFKYTLNQIRDTVREMEWWRWTVIMILIIGFLVLFLLIRARGRLEKNGQPASVRSVFRELFQSSFESIGKLKSQVFRDSGSPKIVVGFYQEFQRMAAAAGFERRASETPQEFADRVCTNFAGELAEKTPGESEQVKRAIQSITQAFYAIRFGGLSDNVSADQDSKDNLETIRAAFSGVSPT